MKDILIVHERQRVEGRAVVADTDDQAALLQKKANVDHAHMLVMVDGVEGGLLKGDGQQDAFVAGDAVLLAE